MCPAGIRQVVWNISLSKLPAQYLFLGHNDDDQVIDNKELVMSTLIVKTIVNDKDMGEGTIYNGGIDDEDLKDG